MVKFCDTDYVRFGTDGQTDWGDTHTKNRTPPRILGQTDTLSTHDPPPSSFGTDRHTHCPHRPPPSSFGTDRHTDCPHRPPPGRVSGQHTHRERERESLVTTFTRTDTVTVHTDPPGRVSGQTDTPSVHRPPGRVSGQTDRYSIIIWGSVRYRSHVPQKRVCVMNFLVRRNAKGKSTPRPPRTHTSSRPRSASPRGQ